MKPKRNTHYKLTMIKNTCLCYPIHMKQEFKNESFPSGWHKSTSLREAFTHAGNGINLAFRTERNLQVQTIIFVLALVLAFIIKLSFLEMAIIILVATMIITLEMVNTAVEHFADIVEPQYSGTIKLIKDITAGAVMLASLSSIVIGLLIFLPPILLSIF